MEGDPGNWVAFPASGVYYCVQQVPCPISVGELRQYLGDKLTDQQIAVLRESGGSLEI